MPATRCAASPPESVPPVASGFPLWPLLVTTAMQTLATMAAFAIPALAPAIGHDLGVDGVLAGYFISLVYGTGIISSLLAAKAIQRFGAERVCQAVLIAALGMLLVSASGSVGGFALGALVLGSTYGATAPVSAHLLVPRTPRSIINLGLSIRQVGVPMGGVLAALVLPPLALRVGWQAAVLLLAVPVVMLLLLLEWPRRRWDAPAHARALPRDAHGAVAGVAAGAAAVLNLLRTSAALRRLSIASFVFAGVQLSFVAFLTVQLTSRAGFGLVAAGQALALYQLAGMVCRPLWGWLADASAGRAGAHRLIVWQGFAMGLLACVAGHLGAHWPVPLILALCAFAGATANGYTGLSYAEFARLGAARRTEATGLGSAAMFSGVLLLPAAAALIVTLSGSYVIAFTALGGMALAAALLLAVNPPSRQE